MDSKNINALATSVIAFVTIIGLMFGFYYNLKIAGTLLKWIILFELLFVLAVGLFVSWVRGGMKDE